VHGAPGAPQSHAGLEERRRSWREADAPQRRENTVEDVVPAAESGLVLDDPNEMVDYWDNVFSCTNRACNVRSLGIGAPGMYYTMTFSIDGDGEKIYDNGSWRSAEHVHLSTGCESMSHGADDKRCPYHAKRQPDARTERLERK